MSESASKDKKANILYIIIAVLIVVSLIQTAVLVQHGQKQKALEKQQAAQLAAAKPMPSAAFARSQTLPRQQATAFQQPFAYQDPWEEFDTMSRRMNSLMRQAFMFASPIMQATNQMRGFDFTPAVDLEETPSTYIVRSDLPGLDKDKINLTIRDNTLTIEGIRQTSSEKEDTQQGFYSQERSYGTFSRSLTLPGPVDENKVTADYKNGVLTITLPKAGEQKNIQKVAIQ